ncbi:transposase [Streptomyces mirabilis]|uniref:IS110 family transposase n=1 Tax=Streptomyces mirabilis TaxID=68239 RepID=UPI0036411727
MPIPSATCATGDRPGPDRPGVVGRAPQSGKEVESHESPKTTGFQAHHERTGVEWTGSYGASLSRYLLTQGVDVFDVNRMDRADRRRRGTSDPLDAQKAARAVLSERARARAKTGDGPVQIARMYKLTKASAVKARTQAINQLKAVLVTADPALHRSAPVGLLREVGYARFGQRPMRSAPPVMLSGVLLIRDRTPPVKERRA